MIPIQIVFRILFLFTLSGIFNTVVFAGVEPASVIKGKVITANGLPAVNVSVQIKGTNKGTITDRNGAFILKKLSAGKYTLQVSLVGYELTEKEIEIGEDETVAIVLEIKLSDKQLEEVVVTKSSFVKKTSDYPARMPLSNIENPQVYNIVSKELLKEQVNTNFDDAVKNLPGVYKLWASTGRGGDGAGYYTMRGFVIQPNMMNGIASVTSGSIDPANIEHIEGIKGPSGTLFGSSLISFGGLMNIVTKKPYENFGGELGYTSGSFGLNRLTADINTPLNEAKTALFRMNAAYHSEKTFQDAGFKKSIFFSPSLSYKINDRLNFLITAEYYNSEAAIPPIIFLPRSRMLVSHTIEELGIDFTRSFTSNDLTIKNPTFNINGVVTYKLSDSWTSQTVLATSTAGSNGYYAWSQIEEPGDSLLTRYVPNVNSSRSTLGIQQNFIGNFKLGSMKNRIVAGLDFYNLNTYNQQHSIKFDAVSTTRKNDLRYFALNKRSLDEKLATVTTPAKSEAETRTYSAYVSDVLNITEALNVMASLRVDYFDNLGSRDLVRNTAAGKYDQVALSPKFGAVYEVIKDKIGIFGNYMNGFKNLAPKTQPDGTVTTFKPQQANQWEGGVKLSLLNNNLTFTASYYNIEVSNTTRTEARVIDGNTLNFTIQNGSLRSKGYEVDMLAALFKGFNVVLGYGYNESENVKSSKEYDGRRPSSSGPAHLANVWLSYTSLCGFGAGFGGNYASENLINNSTITGEFVLPSFTVFNSSIFYDATAYRIALKLDNLTNKEYYGGGWESLEMQKPRALSLNLTFKF